MLREQITEEEYEALHDYRENWAYQSDDPDYSLQVPVKEILSEWEEEKVDLFHLLGDKLILTKEINYHSSESEKRRDLDRFLYSFRDSKHNSQTFLSAYRNWIDKYIGTYHSPHYSQALHLISYDVLLNNAWDWNENFEVPLPDGKVYKITKGTKAIKALSKIASAYNLEGFEEFRLGHSLVLNDKNLKGKLSLSIHPLDYWSMSDNECSWSSCMSWEDIGAYRQGTVEMMNSPYVIVAYLSAETPYQMTDVFKWNNKKWRQLFIVDENIICAIKGYPYQQEHLTKEILYWIAELAKENLGWEYEPSLKYYSNKNICDKVTGEVLYEDIYFTTDYMYNDMDALEQHLCLCPPDGVNDILHDFNYSGETQCVCCGDVLDSISSENVIACENCDHVLRCSECGSSIYGDEYTVIDDYILCCECTDELTDYCTNCGEVGWHEDYEAVTIIVDYTNPEDAWIFNEDLTLCPECYKQLIKKVPIYTDDYQRYIMYQDLAESADKYLPWLLKDGNRQPYTTFAEIKKGCPYSVYPQDLSDLKLE